MRAISYVKALCACLVACQLGANGTALATDVSGAITSDTTWMQALSPYVVTGPVEIASGAVLTIEPGVIIQARSNAPIQVSGTLSAVGTSNQPIVFTKLSGETKAPAIQIVGLSPSNMSATGVFEYCSFSHLTNGNSAISGLCADVSLSYCRFTNLIETASYVFPFPYSVVRVAESRLLIEHSYFSLAENVLFATNSFGIIASNEASSTLDLLYCHEPHTAYPSLAWDIVGNRFGPCGDDTIDVGGLSGTSLMDGNTISNSSDKAMTCRSPAVIRNNVVHHCRTGIDMHTGPCAAANNTFAYCTNTIRMISTGQVVSTIANSILWNPTSTNAQIQTQANLQITYCNISGTGFVPGVGNVMNVNPQFMNSTGANFRLSQTSYCINAGAKQDWMQGAVDVARLPRILGAAVDMGAYEADSYTSNGVPESWLRNFYGAVENYDALAVGDTDGDGQPAWREYQAGTDPTNVASIFRIEQLEFVTGDTYRLNWNATTNARQYSVYCAGSLESLWLPGNRLISGMPPDATGTNSYDVSPPGNQKTLFVGVRVSVTN